MARVTSDYGDNHRARSDIARSQDKAKNISISLQSPIGNDHGRQSAQATINSDMFADQGCLCQIGLRPNSGKSK